MKALCPNCGSDEIVGADKVAASALIADWEDDGLGKMLPVWAGESDVDWDSQAPEFPDKPYACLDCTHYYSSHELKFDNEEGEDDAPPKVNTGRAALSDQQREDAEDLS